MRSIVPDTEASVALSLFDRLGDGSARVPPRPARTRRKADITEQGSRAGRPAQLARVADRRFDLGDDEVGTSLVRKAELLLKKPREGTFPYPIDEIVPVLARADLHAALKLMESRPLTPHQRATIRREIAVRIAARDPAEAGKLIGMLEENAQPAARVAACFRMAATNLAAARALAAEDHDPTVEALLPAIAARRGQTPIPTVPVPCFARRWSDSPGFRAPSYAHFSPAVAIARLLPLAVRVDFDRAPDLLWLALSLRPPLSAVPESFPVMNEVRQHYLDLAELAALVARYDPAAAEAVFAPVADRIARLDDENWGLGNEGPAIFRAAGAFNARVAKTMLESLPEDPPPPPRRGSITPRFHHQSKLLARLALAETLGLPPALRYRQPFLFNDAGWQGDFEVIEGAAHARWRRSRPVEETQPCHPSRGRHRDAT